MAQAQRALTALRSPDVAYYQQLADRAQDDLDIVLKNTGLTSLASAVRQAEAFLTEATNALKDAQTLEATYPGGFTEQVTQAQQAYEAAVENLQIATLSYEQAQISTTNSIEDAQAALTSAEQRFTAAQTGPNTAQVALAEAQVALKQAQLAQAQSEWETLQNGPEALAVSVAQAQVDQAATALAEAQQALEQLEIKAPFAGVVLEADAVAGETMATSAVLFTLTDPQALEVIANVTEEDYPLLSMGQSVEVFFDARPDVTVQGEVERIIPKRLEGDRPLYNIYLSLNEVPDGLADGMTADAAITIAKREGVLCLPRAVVRASSSDVTIVKVWDGVQEVEKEITMGLRGDTYVEIVSGLNEGEQAVTR